MPQTAGRLSSGSAADVRHFDFLFLQARGGVAANLGVAVVAAIPASDEGFENEFVAGALAQKPAQIHAFTGKQAGVELAFGRQAGAGAGVAKRLRDGRDDTDFAGAVSVSPAARHFAEIVWLNRLNGPAGVDALENVRRRYHVIEPPAVGVAHVHEFDEAQHVAAAAKMFGHGLDAVVVHAALDHHVDLDRVKSGGSGVVDAGQHAIDRKLDVVDGLKGVVVQRIEADGNALEPGPSQAPCLFGGKQRSVGGQADVVNAGNVGQQGNQVFQPVAHERFAAGQAQLGGAQAGKPASQAGGPVKAATHGARQKSVIGAEQLFGHAIDTAKIAAVGHRNPQITQQAAKGDRKSAGRERGE